jgi:hypothetical protein
MTDRRRAATAMIVASVLLALCAFLLWAKASRDAKDENLTRDFAEAISGQPLDDVEPNRAPALTAATVGGLLFLGGVILLASTPPVVGEPDDPVPT